MKGPYLRGHPGDDVENGFKHRCAEVRCVAPTRQLLWICVKPARETFVCRQIDWPTQGADKLLKLIAPWLRVFDNLALVFLVQTHVDYPDFHSLPDRALVEAELHG